MREEGTLTGSGLELRLPCRVAAAFSSLAFLASSSAASLASCTSFSAFHSLRLFIRRSSMGVISTWKRLNSCRSGRQLVIPVSSSPQCEKNKPLTL